jgi:hypothetical protein
MDSFLHSRRADRGQNRGKARTLNNNTVCHPIQLLHPNDTDATKSPMLGMCEAIPPLRIRLRGVVLN